MSWEQPPFETLVATLDSASNPIGMRMRAAYYLRQLHFMGATATTTEGSSSASFVGASAEMAQDEVFAGSDNDESRGMAQRLRIVNVLGQNLYKHNHGSLLRHEFAYVMGQLRDPLCCPCLEKVLAYRDDCVMVRHECAEALGAIGENRSVPILREFVKDVHPEIAETCQIAIDFIIWKQQTQIAQEGIQRQKANGNHVEESNKLHGNTDGEKNSSGDEVNVIPPVAACACMLSPYASVDPAPALDDVYSEKKNQNVINELGSILRDSTLPLFKRYRAMFTLRNKNTSASARELGNVLISDATSALLRHEVAYVLGQMQHPASVPMLIQSLKNTTEHVMVRHESAEALGAMSDVGCGCWEEVEKVLSIFAADDDQVVRESCLVALDSADAWSTTPNNDGDLLNHDGIADHNRLDTTLTEEKINATCDVNKEIYDSEHKVLSFAAQKALAGAGVGGAHLSGTMLSKAEMLNNHFNVAVTNKSSRMK